MKKIVDELKKIYRFIVRSAPLIIAFSIVAQLGIDYISYLWEKEDRAMEQSRMIDVELIPYIEENVSDGKSKIVKDREFHVIYEIHFINNNQNDVNISDISFVSGTGYAPISSDGEDIKIMDEVPQVMTLESGSNFYARLSIACPLEYQQLKPLTLEGDTGAFHVINEYLSKNYRRRNTETVSVSDDNKFRRLQISYTTDNDQKKHMVEFNIRYANENIDMAGLLDNIVLEEGFLVSKNVY